MSEGGHVAPGIVIGGDFRVEVPLAAGGMGAVYVAEQLSTGKQRALKVMRPEFVADERSRQRFVDEAKVGARIDSEHVVEVIAAGVDEPTGMPWLAMELLSGQDLDSAVREHGPLSLKAVIDLFEQLGHALGQAHALGIIHRDLKPENLFLARARRSGAPPVIKILDFGIAAFVATDRTAAMATSAIGSPLWLAPEQTQTGANLRPATDVWALGLIAFYLLTGKSYWPAANGETFSLHALLAEILAHPLVPASERAAGLGAPVPAGFDAWFARCVARPPAERFPEAASAAAALAALATAQNDAPVGTVRLPTPPTQVIDAPRPTAPLSARERAARPAAAWIAMGLLAIALIGAGGFAAWRLANDEEEDSPRSVHASLAMPGDPANESPASEPSDPLIPRPDVGAPPVDAGRPASNVDPAGDTGEEIGHAIAARTRERGPALPGRPLARVQMERADVSGPLSPEIIRRVVRRHIQEVRACYDQERNNNPELEGRVAVRFRIELTGAVQMRVIFSSDLRNANVERCIYQAVGRWTFPAPEGGTVMVTQAFILGSP